MWLAPQLILLGIAEAFNGIGQIEFYYKEFPQHMKSIAGSLFFCTIAGASYLSSFIVTIVHDNTGKDGQPDWLDDNLNVGKLDYYYFIIAGMGALNFAYFVVCARFYRYKGSTLGEVEDLNIVIELSTPKPVSN